MGASLDRRQVAVYEHTAMDHPHAHTYINRVPIDGGAALEAGAHAAEKFCHVTRADLAHFDVRLGIQFGHILFDGLKVHLVFAFGAEQEGEA